MMPETKEQIIDSKRGEIQFRKSLTEQQTEGKRVLEDEFDAAEIQNVLRSRMEKTFDQMSDLKKRGIPISPYLELGAERCQRSLVMENDLGATGAAADISYHSLLSCSHYAQVFNKERSPARICCDAYHMPFLSESVPFVFCYETLHHFPEPTPIINEVFRILSPGGYFFFEEEPYKRVLHIDLYKSKKLYSKEKQNPSRMRQIIDPFFAQLNCNEIEHGIIENFKIPLSVWKNALGRFGEKDVVLRSMRTTELFEPKNRLNYILAYLFGGVISGTCRKPGHDGLSHSTIFEGLACPSCIEDGRERKITMQNGSFHCSDCQRDFPIVDGIAFLFSDKNFKQLYPEVMERSKAES
jgi:SAM-dependent methyltransferase/uncharacterized protein YbaR (Trm112 family)